MIQMSGDDPRFRCLRPESIRPLTLDTVRHTVLHHLSDQLANGQVELNVVGDIDLDITERLAHVYLGKGLQIPTVKEVDAIPALVGPERASQSMEAEELENKQEPPDPGTHKDAEPGVVGPKLFAPVEQRVASPFVQLYYRQLPQEGQASSSLSSASVLGKDRKLVLRRDSSGPAAISHSALPRKAPSAARLSDEGKRVRIHVIDSDERAVIHLVGHAPNRWGIPGDDQPSSWKILSSSSSSPSAYSGNVPFALSTSSSVPSSPASADHDAVETAATQDQGKERDFDPWNRRTHPAFGRVAMWLLQEIVSKRMFSVVRDAHLRVAQPAWPAPSAVRNVCTRQSVRKRLLVCKNTSYMGVSRKEMPPGS